MLHSTFLLSCLASLVSAALTESSLEKHVDSLSLSSSFNPIKESYWTGYPHHRRTPFAVSPDGKTAYLAYLDSSDTDVHVQEVDPSTFAAVGDATTVSGAKEAGGLIAHNDGFALLTNEALPSGTADAPADSTPVPVLYRYTSGEQSWKTFLGGPGVHESDGLSASPDLSGDLAYSEAAGIYGAYFVVTDYSGDASGHYGDSVQYVNDNGTLETITGASSSWGCSHNTGIAFEAADSAPFASICAEDQGAIWLNTQGQTMDGVKISNENTTNGGSGEPLGGMSGSYSGLARFIDSDEYIFAWVSRGAKYLTTNTWLGSPFTNALNRTNNRNVAIARFSDKNTLIGDEATSTLGDGGDSQVNWITTGTADCSNAHVAAFDGSNALVTWEEIAEPTCDFIAMGCKGAFTGAYYQLVNNGEKVGEPLKETDVFVAGDMVTMSDGRICWPYVSMDWTLDGPVSNPATVTKISFACISLEGSSSNSTTSAASSSVASAVASSTAAALSSSPAASSAAAAAKSQAAAVSNAASSSSIRAASLTSASRTTVRHPHAPSSAVLEAASTSVAISSAAISLSSVADAAATSQISLVVSSDLPSFALPSSGASISSASVAVTFETVPPSVTSVATSVALATSSTSQAQCISSTPAIVTVTAQETVTVTVSVEQPEAASATAQPTRQSAKPSFGGARPSGAPFPSGLGMEESSLPFPSGRPRATGSRPSGGFPRPSGRPHPSAHDGLPRARPAPTGH